VTSVAVSSRAITRVCAAVSPRVNARRLSSSSSSERVGATPRVSGAARSAAARRTSESTSARSPSLAAMRAKWTKGAKKFGSSARTRCQVAFDWATGRPMSGP